MAAHTGIPGNETYFHDIETATTILNSQNVVSYEKIIALLGTFHLPESNSYT